MANVQVLTSTTDISRDEWLAWRRRGIGGSDAAAIAGLSRWRSPMTVYLDKVGELPEEEPGEAARWGALLEDVVAREFAERTGLKVQRRNAILQHPEHPFMLANIDRHVICPERGWGVLEVKTTSAYNRDAWEEDRIPDEYLLQLQHYLAVTGLGFGYVAVLIGGQRFKHQLVERDEELINYLVKIEADFWSLVLNRTPPEMDGSQASTEVLSLLYPASEPDSVLDLPEQADDLIRDFEEASLAEKEWAARKDEAANKLKAMLGTYEVGRIGARRVTWKSVTSTRLDTKGLKAEMPAVYEQYARVSQTRRFIVK